MHAPGGQRRLDFRILWLFANPSVNKVSRILVAQLVVHKSIHKLPDNSTNILWNELLLRDTFQYPLPCGTLIHYRQLYRSFSADFIYYGDKMEERTLIRQICFLPVPEIRSSTGCAVNQRERHNLTRPVLEKHDLAKALNLWCNWRSHSVATPRRVHGKGVFWADCQNVYTRNKKGINQSAIPGEGNKSNAHLDWNPFCIISSCWVFSLPDFSGV